MDIGAIIKEIQHSECMNCRIGKCLMALRDLQLDEQPRVPAANPDTAKKPSAIKAKDGPKSGRAPNSKAQAILDYLATHPASSVGAMETELHIPYSAIGYHLRTLSDKGKVKMLGKGRAARWSLAEGKSGNSGRSPKAGAGATSSEAGKPYGCEKCGKRFWVHGSLLSHVRTEHSG